MQGQFHMHRDRAVPQAAGLHSAPDARLIVGRPLGHPRRQVVEAADKQGPLPQRQQLLVSQVTCRHMLDHYEAGIGQPAAGAGSAIGFPGVHSALHAVGMQVVQLPCIGHLRPGRVMAGLPPMLLPHRTRG
jgi:hypothetical protein